MKKSVIAITITSLLLASLPVYAEEPMYMAPPGMKIEVEVTYDENGRKVITTHCSPIDDYMIQSESFSTGNSAAIKKPEALAEAPEIGITLGHILNEYASPEAKGWERFTEFYQDGISGQCTWYARGRFKEIYNLELPYLSRARYWLENAQKDVGLKITKNLSDISDYSIAVYEPTPEFYDYPGHVKFIEYVERDQKGYPINVYYSDANGKNDLNKDKYDEGYDGAVQKESFEKFKSPYGLKLIGYILPNFITDK